MTEREFFRAVSTGTIDEDIIAFAGAKLAKLDASLAKRAGASHAEREAFADGVVAVLAESADGFLPASIVAGALGVSTQKASYALTDLVNEGKAESTVMTVGEGKSKRKVKGYRLVTAQTEEPAEPAEPAEDHRMHANAVVGV